MSAKVNIRRCSEADWPAVWDIMEPVIRVGDTYPYAMDMTVDGARQMWLEIPAATYVAEDTESNILGTYYLKPHQPTLGAHVANCGYIVAERARGMGIATQMCEHTQDEAIRMASSANKYNLRRKEHGPDVLV